MKVHALVMDEHIMGVGKDYKLDPTSFFNSIAVPDHEVAIRKKLTVRFLNNLTIMPFKFQCIQLINTGRPEFKITNYFVATF